MVHGPSGAKPATGRPGDDRIPDRGGSRVNWRDGPVACR
ncbi:hypothetical protein SBD_6676 [Streptomyces bottropensis ATCC 25435]|uniref:Uncharacterized protein n=1 Tax=Streptomyces bottropensis ATCC 25435 TaxID=1054862 RepID=M3E7R2_9ACTN|nr:hypothetical protein SBD_6676 [Streptomyces bottropensis ATCC 25435]